MDKKIIRRRKSIRRTSNGRSEEKPKVPEVTREKEEKDRLEAANVLSSLMFLPPKSPTDLETDEAEIARSALTTTSSVTYFPNDSGIPTRSLPHHLQLATQGAQPRGRGTNINAAAMIEQLQCQIKQAYQNKASNIKPDQLILLPQGNGRSMYASLEKIKTRNLVQMSSSLPRAVANQSSKVQNSASHTPLPNTGKLPVTLNPGITVNKTVASALRNKIPSVSESEKAKADILQSTDESGKADNSSSKKKDSDTNLPLKKRRLIGIDGSSDDLLTSDLNLPSKLDSLTSAQLNSLQLSSTTEQPGLPSLVSTALGQKSGSEEGYRPVKFDPRTSLLVLQDVRVALTPDEDGDLPIHVAVVHENVELVQKFIDIMAMSGKTVDRFNKLQQTPLHLAILVDQPKIVIALLTAGANPNLPDRNGCTSVHLAVCKEFSECLDALFTHSLTPPLINTRDYEGYSPLHTCVELDNLDIMQSLVEHEAEINAQDGKAGRSVLFYATEYQRVDIVDYLLDAGASAEMLNYAGVSALMTAQSANMDEIERLLKKALDIYVHDDLQYTHSKKVPIPRIPSKSTLITNEHEGFRSRSNSQEFKPLSRQSSVGSNASPIDLSIPRNANSPAFGPQIRQKGAKRLRKEPKAKLETSSKSSVKQKHASLLAALEGRFVDKSLRTSFLNERYKSLSQIKTEDDFDEVTSTVSDERISSGNKIQSDQVDDEDNSDSDSMETSNIKKYRTDKTRAKKTKSSRLPHPAFRGKYEEQTHEMEVDSVDSPQMPVLSRQDSAASEMDEDASNKQYPDLARRESGFGTNVWNKTGPSPIKPINLESQQWLASRTMLASNFSDILKSLPGSLISADVFEMMKPLMSQEMFTSLQMQLPQLPSQVSSQLPSQIPKLLPQQSSPANPLGSTNNLSVSQKLDLRKLPPLDKIIEANSIPVKTSQIPPVQVLNKTTMKLPNVPSETCETESKNTPEELEKTEDFKHEKSLVISHGSPDFDQSKVLNSEESCEANPSKSDHSETKMDDSETDSDREGMDISNRQDEAAAEIESTDTSNVKDDNSKETRGNDKIVSDGQENDENDKSVENVKSPVNIVAMETDDFYDDDIDDDEKDLVIDETEHESRVNDSCEENVAQNDKLKQNGIENGPDIDPQRGKSNANTEHKTDLEEGVAATPKNKSKKEKKKEKLKKSPVNKKHTKRKDKGISDVDSVKLTLKEAAAKHVNERSGKLEPVNSTSAGLDSASETSDSVTSTNTKIKPMSVSELKPSSSSFVKDMKIGTSSNVMSSAESKTTNTPTIPNVVPSTSVVGDVLKQGKSHTLFYKDVQGYKPIRIFIDDSEQSSLVLQTMLQATQLIANVNSTNSEAPSVQTSVTESGKTIHTKNLVSGRNDPMQRVLATKPSATISSRSKVPIQTAGTPVAQLNTNSMSAVAVLNRPITTAKISPQLAQAGSFQNAYIESLKKPMEGARRMTTTPIISKNTITDSAADKVPNHNHVPVSEVRKIMPEFVAMKIPMMPENIKPVRGLELDKAIRKSGANPVIDPMSQRFMPSDWRNRQFKTATANEGTLTKVNPDIKSRLSKALQSPQRKAGNTNSATPTVHEGDANIPNQVHKSLTSNSNSATVTETRQQL